MIQRNIFLEPSFHTIHSPLDNLRLSILCLLHRWSTPHAFIFNFWELRGEAILWVWLILRVQWIDYLRIPTNSSLTEFRVMVIIWCFSILMCFFIWILGNQEKEKLRLPEARRRSHYLYVHGAFKKIKEEKKNCLTEKRNSIEFISVYSVSSGMDSIIYVAEGPRVPNTWDMVEVTIPESSPSPS